jgi:hypothetical protein
MEEVLQTFNEKEESTMFKLQFKSSDNIGDIEALKTKVVRFRKQTLEIDGVIQVVVLIRNMTDTVEFEKLVQKQHEERGQTNLIQS